MIVQPVLSVRDVAASLKFYTEVLGFPQEGEALPGPDGQPNFASVMVGPVMVMFNGTWERKDAADSTPRGVGVELHVALDNDRNIDTMYEKLKSQGVKIAIELKEEFWGDKRFGIFDPDGYLISFAQTVRQVSMEEMAEISRQGAPQNQ